MTAPIDTAARIAIVELFARYCHRVDHGDGAGWAALFEPTGSFEVEGIMRLEGTDQLRSMPGVVTDQGGGKWRHQVTNIAIEPGADADTASVRAYGLVTDWRDGGRPVSFTDYEITLARSGDAWRIRTLLARMP